MRTRHSFAVFGFFAIVSLSLFFRSGQQNASPGHSSSVKSAPTSLPQPTSPSSRGVPLPVSEPVSEEARTAYSTLIRENSELRAFASWTQRFIAAEAADRPVLIEEGARLARERRPVFKKLITDDPRLALEEAVPMVVRQQLPEVITEQLEKRLNGTAVLRVYQGVPMPGVIPPQESLTQRVVEFEYGKSYRAHVYGALSERVTSMPGASLNGVAIDADFAVNDAPSRTLEVGEFPNPAKPVVRICPVSGRSAASIEAGETISESTPAVETATEVVQFCAPEHITEYNLRGYADGGSGGESGFTGILPAVPTPSLGNIKVLVIPVCYVDKIEAPSTEANLAAVMRDVGAFYARASYGRVSLVSTIAPLVKLPHTEAWYVNRDVSNGGDIWGKDLIHGHARQEARRIGFDDSGYDCVVVRHNGGPEPWWGGYAAGSSIWARHDGPGMWAHEIGHCFGLAHSNFWNTGGTSTIGAGANEEYGDVYDIMGNSGSFPAGDYNVQAKHQIKWLPSNFVRNANQSGLYRIYAFDQGTLLPERDYALKIVKDVQKTYWGEVRSLYDSNPNVKNGLLLGWNYGNGGGWNLQRLDTTPGSPSGKNDAPISLGATFSDREAGIHMTTVAVNESPRSMDIRVNFGMFPGNHSPTLALNASATVVPIGVPVSFTASASDEDGDELAYSWQHFGDSTLRVESNSPVISRVFDKAGTYVVSCTVSDMKGGVATRNQLITVGDGAGRYTISGRVTLLGKGLRGVMVTANGASGVITDSEGNFAIPNLTSNTYALSPLLYGYTFGALFNNSVTVGPNAAGADFEATPTPVVTITASQPNATEKAPVIPGRFTIQRSGSTSQALDVNVNWMQGSASKGGDYTLTPDYVSGSQGFSTFTIPAGAASLDVAVTPVADSAAEGPETVILQLGPGNGYLAGGPASATVYIADDDTTLPQVSVQATNGSLLENSSTPGAITFARTGSTGAALVVNYTVGGTAANGVDFSSLSGSLTIPAGAPSATVNVVPVNDGVSESLETVVISIGSSGNYLIDSKAKASTVNLVDDDMQVLTVVAADPEAKEVDFTKVGAVADPGTFIVSRAGDVINALTVYYAVSGTRGAGSAAQHGVDYEPLPGVLVIPAGVSQMAVTIIPRYDGTAEGPELVQFTLGAGSAQYVVGSPGTAIVTIRDSDADKPDLEVSRIRHATEPLSAGSFRITRRGDAASALVVRYKLEGTAINGTDYTIGNGGADPGTITFAPGASTVDISVNPVDDLIVEDLETVTLSIVVDEAYRFFAPTATASMWLYDAGTRAVVFVDTQVGSNGSSTASEGGGSSPIKFYVSRGADTTNALTVNFLLSGSATSGSDYSVVTGASLTFDNTIRSGVLTIPAGSRGADVPLTITNDTAFEGTETIALDLASGNYSRGPGALMTLNDNESNAQKVSFDQASASGLESVSTVNIPVSLASAAVSPVTVEYFTDSATSNPSTFSHRWVRMVKTGTSFASFISNDGVTWRPLGNPQNLTGFTATNYLAGLCVTSHVDATLGKAVFDSVTISDLSAGGTQGAVTGADIGAVGAAGNHSVSGGVYTIRGSGADIWGSADEFRYVWFPITSSANCTITARVTSQDATDGWAKAGVMIRESNATGSRYASTLITPSNGSNFQVRSNPDGGSSNAGQTTSLLAPLWLRLERVGDVFTASQSSDGIAWNAVGSPQTIALAPGALAGLAVCARDDNAMATATFDNVVLTRQPVLQGRTVGYVGSQGTESFTGGVWTVSASGAQIGAWEDECHFLAAPVNGDFTLTARVVTQSGGHANAQAGVMVRENGSKSARSIYVGSMRSMGTEFFCRKTTFSTALGSGVDYANASGVLTFGPGEKTKFITLAVSDDTIIDPNENLSISLRNPTGAQLGSITQYSYTIIDNDATGWLPVIGFASAEITVAEGGGMANLLVSLSAPASTSVSVDYAVTGGTASSVSDYSISNGTLVFAPGETVKSIPVTIVQDSAVESSETVIVSLSNAVGAQMSSLRVGTLTISDDDFPAVSITATDDLAAENGDVGTFTVTRVGSLSGALTVRFTRKGSATNGVDFTDIPSPGSVTIPNGKASNTVTITPLQDTANEGKETVVLELVADASYALSLAANATVSIADDDRSVVTIVASSAVASESGGNPGQFTITRSVPTTEDLTVNLAITGSASKGSDYVAISNSVTIPAGSVTAVINVVPVDDSVTEGGENVTVSVASGAYEIGAASFANVTIADNDNPPVVNISNPGANGALVANGQGVILVANVTDDGAPQPVTLVWKVVAGPGTATIESPASATTAVTFSEAGNYVLRVTATDGQFTVSDEVTVVVGVALVAADWISQDLGPSPVRRGQGLQHGELYSVSGTGTGYSGGRDGAHVMARAVDGNSTIVARLGSVSSNDALAGVTIRDSMMQGARRAVLGFVPGKGLQFRVRANEQSNDSVTTQAGLALPLWLKLERNGANNEITASYSADAAGAPGVWTTLGTPTVTLMDSRADVGLTTTSNSTASVATAAFDKVTLTPARIGPALISEDTSLSPAGVGSASVANGTYTVTASTGGYCHGWQFFGDLVATVRLQNITSSAVESKAGLLVAENFEGGGYAFAGRGKAGFQWRPIAGGFPSSLDGTGDKLRWFRIIRSGNSVQAFSAPDVSGSPGVWVQFGQPQLIIMTAPIFVGLYANAEGSVGMSTATFTSLSIEPLNRAPLIDLGNVPTSVVGSLNLDATVTDDGQPQPATLTTQWSSSSGVTFTNSAAIDTSVSAAEFGNFRLRLRASDTEVITFRDALVAFYKSGFQSWQAQNFAGDPNNPAAAANADPDRDGIANFMEYGMGTQPNAFTATPWVLDQVTVGSSKYLRLTIPKNPAAGDLTYEVQASGNIGSPLNWSSSGLVTEQNTSTSLRVRDSVPIGTTLRRFLRATVKGQP